MTARGLRPPFTVDQWITVLLVAAVVALILVGFLAGTFWFPYLLFVLLTVFVVRSVPVEPGAWLGLRIVRRVLVAIIALITIWFLVANTFSIPALLALALCDFALGRATRRIASASSEVLDERQHAWRNRGYQIAFLIFGLAAGGVLVVADLATPATRQWLAGAIQSGAAMISFLELLIFLPSMVIAWREPDRVSDEEAPRLRQGGAARLAAVMVVLCLVIPLVLSFSLMLLPVRVSSFTEPEAEGPSADSTCRYFGARKEVGFGIHATIPISAAGCWNGTRAYEEWGMNANDCVINTIDGTTVSTLECRRTTDSNGTLHFVLRSLVHSAFLPFIVREVTMRLDLTKDGKVVQFP